MGCVRTNGAQQLLAVRFDAAGVPCTSQLPQSSVVEVEEGFPKLFIYFISAMF